MKLYVGNLAWSIDNQKLSELFSEFGTVTSANIIMDKYSGRSKGFGFVEMSDDDAAKKAITALNGKAVEGRELKVSEATPQAER